VRYAKYVAIGSLVATVGAGAFGTVVSGAGFVLAPTGVVGTCVAAGVWGGGRWVVRRVGRKWGHEGDGEEREDEEEGGHERYGGGRFGEEMPW